MPIYEYICTNCESRTEVFFNTTSAPNYIECDCGNTMYKIISTINISKGGNLSGIDDTDDLTIGKLIANKGIPSEHKRQINNKKERIKKVKEYEKNLKIKQEKYQFKN